MFLNKKKYAIKQFSLYYSFFRALVATSNFSLFVMYLFAIVYSKTIFIFNVYYDSMGSETLHNTNYSSIIYTLKYATIYGKKPFLNIVQNCTEIEKKSD